MVAEGAHAAVGANVSAPGVIASLCIFIASYGIIISEKIHRTTVALFGAALMVIAGIIFGFYDQESAVRAIDFNTIGLLVGMMMIVAVVKDTGFFQYLAVKSAKLVKGDPWKIMLLFAVITAMSSALLDNVTTVLLLTPMTIVICNNLKINPIPFLFVEILTSNIGGTATLIGDPPNILIGSAAKLSFLDFVVNVGPPSAVVFVVVMFFLRWKYKDEIQTGKENMERIMKLDEKESLKDVVLLKKSMFVLTLVIIAFFLHGWLHLEGATIALLGAGLLLMLDHKNVERALHEHCLKEIEWETIFFFSGLFILVGGIEHAGVISWAAERMIDFTEGSLAMTTSLVLWGGAIFSAFVDNIPFVATMIPMVKGMGGVFPDLGPIWWSLSLGACLGGNGTLVGASANLVVAGMAGKAGYKIKFVEFMKVGLIVMFISVAISHVYVWLRFL